MDSPQRRRFLWARNLLAKAPCWNFPKRGGNGASHKGYYFYYPQSSTIIKSMMAATDNIRNTHKVSPTQNTPALQASVVTQRSRNVAWRH